MTDERCACGKFLAMPGGMAQIEDGVYHVEAGAPACEVLSLRSEVERLSRERDEAVDVLREVEWSQMDDCSHPCCPVCAAPRPARGYTNPGHDLGCRLSALLAARGGSGRGR